MASITLQQHDGESPRSRVVTVTVTGERFIAIDFGRDATLILHGRDTAAIASARELASVLIQATNIIGTALTAKQELAD